MPEQILGFIVPVIVILLLLCIVASNVRVVQQSRAYVIERDKFLAAHGHEFVDASDGAGNLARHGLAHKGN